MGSPRSLFMNTFISMRTLSYSHLQYLTSLPISIQAGSAKFTASAMLNPALNPEWQALALAITNSRGFCTILCNFIPFFRRTLGSIRVVLCLRNSGHSLKQSVKCSYAKSSKSSLSSRSTVYQNFGAPVWRQLIEYKSKSSLCQPNNDLHTPTYRYG